MLGQVVPVRDAVADQWSWSSSAYTCCKENRPPTTYAMLPERPHDLGFGYTRDAFSFACCAHFQAQARTLIADADAQLLRVERRHEKMSPSNVDLGLTTSEQDAFGT